MKLKSKCCKKCKKKGKACRKCPLMASLSDEQRRRFMHKVRKRLGKAA